jgi:hypothetical protein
MGKTIAFNMIFIHNTISYQSHNSSVVFAINILLQKCGLYVFLFQTALSTLLIKFTATQKTSGEQMMQDKAFNSPFPSTRRRVSWRLFLIVTLRNKGSASIMSSPELALTEAGDEPPGPGDSSKGPSSLLFPAQNMLPNLRLAIGGVAITSPPLSLFPLYSSATLPL